MNYTTAQTDQLEALRHMHPGWKFWIMDRAVGDVVWYAQLLTEPRAVKKASSAAELSKVITEWEKAAGASH